MFLDYNRMSSFFHFRFKWVATVLGIAVLMAAFLRTEAATLPEGFVEESVGTGWVEPVGIAFGKNADGTQDRAHVWERAGKVWIVENGQKLPSPLLDISEEVGAFRDMGMLGFAFDPNFQTNGFFYVLYVVDRHHLLNFGTSRYNATTDDYFAATIGRLTRYTARRSDDYRTADPASRKVLLGETKSTGFPILYHTHGTGSLVFGMDGSLLVSCGDAASAVTVDKGGDVGGSYAKQALADGIITSQENIGAFRCQNLNSLNGKILRLNPATGDGLPGNPFYQKNTPRSAKSRIYAYGLRNPFRFALKPGTGSHNQADGDPGVLLVGDVGWSSAEELNIVDKGGLNFGWPSYEGFSKQGSYWPVRPSGYDAANHTPPIAVWRNEASVMTPGQSQPVTLGAPGTEALGPDFNGFSSVGGTWYAGKDFPAEWRNVYFHADYGGKWIRAFDLDGNYKVIRQRTFLTSSPVVCVATHPETGGLYYMGWSGAVKKISHAPGGNYPPTAVAHVSKQSGISPLEVVFSSIGSKDPDGGELSCHWDFGDGSTSTEANPYKVYTAEGPQKFQAKLTVRDAKGAAATASVSVSVNNTAPQIAISSPPPLATFPISGAEKTIPLQADVVDAEHGNESLSYCWKVFLVHNTHTHSEPEQTTRAGVMTVSPLPPSATDFYYYRVVLTVTDPLGPSTSAESIVFPASGMNAHGPYGVLGSLPPVIGSLPLGKSSVAGHANGQPSGNGNQPVSVPIQFSEPVTGLEASDFVVTNGVVSALTGSGSTWTLSIIPSAPGFMEISLPAGKCVDATGTPNVAGLSVSTFFLPTPDLIPPGVVLSGPMEISGSFPLKIDFSEAVSGLSLADFHVFNATLSELAGSGAQYSMTVTPRAAGSVFVRLPEGAVQDAGGNANKSSNQMDIRFLLKDENKPPQLAIPPAQFAVRGDAIMLPVFAVDAEGGTLAFSASGLPPGLVIDSRSGVISGVIQQTAGENYSSTITVTDGTLPISATLSWSIKGSASEGKNGVLGEYYVGEKFGSLILTRTDSEINFFWPETTEPGPGLPGDYYSVRWTAKLKVPDSGSWKFYADADDGIRVWINGRLVIDHWNPEPSTSFNLTGPAIELKAEEKHDIKVEFQDFFSDGMVHLKWEGPNVVGGIPASAYFLPVVENAPPHLLSPGPQASAVGEIVAVPVLYGDTDGQPVTIEVTGLPQGLIYNPMSRVIEGSATKAGVASVKIVASDGMAQSSQTFAWTVASRPAGLSAEYFNGLWFESTVLKRTDPHVNFYWGKGRPTEGVNADEFSVLWTGFVVPRQQGEHVFKVVADDGARLWVDNQLIYDNWNGAGTQEASLPIALTTQRAVPIRVEYRDASGAARCELYWKTGGGIYEIVPSSRLLPTLNGSGLYAISNEEDAAAASPPAWLAAVAGDFPRLERSIAIVVRNDGAKELRFVRQPDLGEGAVLQVSPDLVSWTDVPATNWPVATQSDGTETVTVPDVSRVLGVTPAGRLFARFRLRE